MKNKKRGKKRVREREEKMMMKPRNKDEERDYFSKNLFSRFFSL